MGFRSILFVIIGLALVFFSYAAHAQSCSEISIITDDTILNENETDSHYSVSLENNSDERFYIDDVEVRDNSSFFEATYSSRQDNSVNSGSNADIYLRLRAFDVDYDRTGIVTVKVQGHFSNGHNCSFSSIVETFRVEVQNSSGSSTGDCSDIGIQTFNFHVPESSTTYKILNISNDSSDNFIIEDAQVRDNSSFFSLDRTYQSTVNPNSGSDLRLIVYSTSVSSQQSGTGYVKLRGYFQDGGSCSFSDIGEKSFTVTVDDSSSGSCGNIDLETENVFADEDNTEYNTFSINNNSDRSFTVEEVRIGENSQYYSQNIENFDQTITPNSTGDVRVKTIANSVSGNKTDSSTLEVRGHFSDGNTCSLSDLQKSFLTKVSDTENNGDEEDNGESTSAECEDLAIESHSVSVNENDSVFETFFLRNSAARNFYIDAINVYDNDSGFAASALDFDKTAYRTGEKAAINFKAQAYDATSDYSGKAFVQVRGHYSNGQTCSYSSIGTKEFSVEVNTVASYSPAPIQPLPAKKAVEIINYPSNVEFANNTFIAVTVKNNSVYAKSITLGFSGFPATIMLETSTYNVAAGATKTVYLDIDARGTNGTFNGTLFVQAGNEKDTKPIVLAMSSGGTISEIEMQVQVSKTLNAFNVLIKLKNNSAQAVSGKISLDVPGDWNVSGISDLVIPAGEEKTTVLLVAPNMQLQKETLSSVTFTASDGRKAKQIISFTPDNGIIGTAMVLLSEGIAAVGLLVLAIIVLLFVWQKLAK